MQSSRLQQSSTALRPVCGPCRCRHSRLRVSSILQAPPTQKAAEAADSGLWRSAATLVNGFRIWPSGQDAVQAAVQAPPQQQQQALPPAAPDSSVAQQVPLDCSAFLGTCSNDELRYMRMLSHLCAQTYYMGQLTPRKLKMWHNLELISSSLCCERLVYEHSRTDEEVLLEADGMAGPSFMEALDIYASSSDESSDSSTNGSSSSSSGVPLPVAPIISNNVVPFAKGAALLPVSSPVNSSTNAGAVRAAAAAYSAAAVAAAAAQQAQAVASSSSSSSSMDVPSSDSSKRGGWNPADLVAAKLSEAAAAASAAALQPLAEAAGSLYAGSLSLMSSVTSSVTSTTSSMTSSVTSFGPAADRVVREAIAGIASAEVAGSHPNSKDVKAASTSSGTKCPSEWFVCDSEASNMRYFVIQGSDSLDHWKTNLMFDPVPFEDAELGIRVHRGAYEAALALYDRFLPLVQEQVDKDPTARVCFTGHSIGGSLAVLLMIMFRHRGVLLPQQIAPVYTFGTPGIFCDGALGVCSACTEESDGAEACGVGASLLSRLGLREDIVRSIIMTRDVVPRAFSCDYSLVAELLRSWGPSFKEHSCLSGGTTGAGRRQLYVHLGSMFVLQPSPELPFITEPQPHLPLLPQHPEVFELLPRPTLSNAMAAARLRAKSMRNGFALGKPASTKEEVLAAIMDTPHPLETLADPGGYGSNGIISRYHNPDNYCMALGRLLADRRSATADQFSRAPFVVPARAAQHRPFFPVSISSTAEAQAARLAETGAGGMSLPAAAAAEPQMEDAAVRRSSRQGLKELQLGVQE